MASIAGVFLILSIIAGIWWFVYLGKHILSPTNKDDITIFYKKEGENNEPKND